MSKLSPLTIIVLGVSIGFVAISWAFFTQWMPNMAEAEYNRQYARDLETEANKLHAAQQRRDKAIEMVNEKTRQWVAVSSQHTPPSTLAGGGIDLGVNAWQLVVDTRKFRNNIQRAVNAQMKKGGIEVINGPLAQFPPETASTILSEYFNYPAFPYPVVFYDFGTLTVRGTYSQIKDHLLAWASMPNYLAVTDGLVLSGTSPILTATYNLSMVAFIRANDIFPPVPEGGGGGGGGPAGSKPAGGGGRRGGL